MFPILTPPNKSRVISTIMNQFLTCAISLDSGWLNRNNYINGYQSFRVEFQILF